MCSAWNHTRATHCCNCGEEFKQVVNIQTTASELELLAGSNPVVETFPVRLVTYAAHNPHNGRAPSLRVTYNCGLRTFREFVCLEHLSGLVRHKSREWWRARSPTVPPETVGDALVRAEKELAIPTHVQVWVNKKYPEIMAYCYDGSAFGEKKV